MVSMVSPELDRVYTSTDLTQGAAPSLGSEYSASDGKVYRFLQYDTGAGSVAAVAGNSAGYYAPSGASAGSTTVITSDVSDTAGVCAGLLMSAPADGEYCWVQTRGRATMASAFTAGADGNALTLTGAGDGKLDVSAAVTDHVAAVSIDASAFIVMLTCP